MTAELIPYEQVEQSWVRITLGIGTPDDYNLVQSQLQRLHAYELADDDIDAYDALIRQAQ